MFSLWLQGCQHKSYRTQHSAGAVLKNLWPPNFYSPVCTGSTCKKGVRCSLKAMMGAPQPLKQRMLSAFQSVSHHCPQYNFSLQCSTLGVPLALCSFSQLQCFSQCPGCHWDFSPGLAKLWFWKVSSQNQESDQICLKMGLVSFKPRHKLQQSLGFDFLVKLETTCVPHALGFCCEYLTQLSGNNLFLWAFSISYPSQNHKKQRLENMKTKIMWEKRGLNFLSLRQSLCSFRAQSKVLN